MKPRISIGIPIYNRAKYIALCASSLFEQTYQNIEYVFIDDGSTDDSIKILNTVISKYPQRKADVRIIRHQKNFGLWKARNTSINNMTGEYVAFCDADDWVEPDYIDKFVAAIKGNCDMIVNTSYYENCNNYQRIINSDTKDFCEINNTPIDVAHFSIWNKLIKRSLIERNNLRVPQNVNCWEDVSITARLYILSKKIYIISSETYHYRKLAQDSYTSTNHTKRLIDQINCAKFIDEWIITKGLNVHRKYQTFINHLKFSSKIKFLRGDNKDVSLWKKTFKEANASILGYYNIKLYIRIFFILILITPTPLTQLIYNNIINKKRSN